MIATRSPLLLLLCWTSVVSKRCCPDDLHVTSRICSDNKTNIDLPCLSKKVAFLLDPTKGDHFHVSEEDDTLIVDDAGYYVESTEYCVSQIRRASDSDPTEHDVAIVCHVGGREKGNPPWYLVLMIISTIFILVTLLIYVVIPELRDLQGKLLMICISSLTTAYTTIVSIHLFNNFMHMHDYFCVITGYTLYVSFLSTFSWQNVISFNLWRVAMFRDSLFDERSLLRYYVLWGAGVPMMLLVVNLIARFVPGDHYRSTIGHSSCWFAEHEETWTFFYGPMSILVAINVVLFVWTSLLLWKHTRGQPLTKLRSMRFRWYLYLKLFLIMGINWSFEIISFAFQGTLPKWVWYLTDFINCSQGTIIFCVFILFRQRVRRGLARNKVFGIKWPYRWIMEEVEETESSVADELELSRDKG